MSLSPTSLSRLAFLGTLSIISSSGFSYANEMAGMISHPRSIQRMRTVEMARGIWMMIKRMKGRISGMLDYKV
jgi:hypothetical protein